MKKGKNWRNSPSYDLAKRGRLYWKGTNGRDPARTKKKTNDKNHRTHFDPAQKNRTRRHDVLGREGQERPTRKLNVGQDLGVEKRNL